MMATEYTAYMLKQSQDMAMERSNLWLYWPVKYPSANVPPQEKGANNTDKSYTWQFCVTFVGWLRLSDLQLRV